MHKRLPIFYSAILLTFVNLLLRLVSTGFQILLSRRIGAAGIGLVQLVMSVSAMGITAGIGGIRTAAMYLCAEEYGREQPANVPWVLSGCIRYSLIVSGAVGLLIFLAAPTISTLWIGNVETVSALRLFSVFLPIICLSAVFSGLFTASGQILTLSAVGVGEHLLSLGITIGLLTLWAGKSAPRAAMAMVLGNGIGASVTLCSLVILRLKEKEPTGDPIPVAKRLWNTAVPLAVADDVKSCISTTEHLMVPKRLALFPAAISPLALFGMVQGMVFPILMFPAAILFGLSELLIPELARCAAANRQKRIHYLTKRSLRVTLLYAIALGGLLFLLADSLCLTLYKTQEPEKYLRLFACLVPMLYCDMITDAVIKGLGQQKYSVRINILTSLMDVILLFFLLPKFGLPGYFASFLVTHLINFLLSILRLMKTTKEALSLSVILRAFSCGGIALWVSGFCVSPFLRAGTYLLLLFSLLTLLGVLSAEDRTWLIGLMKHAAPDKTP